MRITVIIFLIYILSSNVFSSETLILDCHNLGEGNITRLKIIQTKDGLTHLTEIYDDDTNKVREVTESELRQNQFSLSSYYGYKRTLKKKANNVWVVAWGCGEEYEATCTDF